MHQRNDSEWYRDIALHGYSKITDPKLFGYSDSSGTLQSSWAFFPLYPALQYATIKTFHISYDVSAAIWGFLLSILAFWGLYYFSKEAMGFSQHHAFYLVAAFMLFPFHFYFSMAYTEALFFSLLIYTFIFIDKKQYLLAGVMMFLLCLCRPNGIVSLLPLYLFHLERTGILKKWGFDFRNWVSWRSFAQSLAFALGLLSFLLFAYYQKNMTGEYFAFSKAQSGWRKTFMFPLLALFREGNWRMQFHSVYTLLAMATVISLRNKLPLSLQILVWLGLILPMSAGSMVSMPRYISVLFPLFFLPINGVKMSRFIHLGLLGLWILQLLVFQFWLRGDTFSY